MLQSHLGLRAAIPYYLHKLGVRVPSEEERVPDGKAAAIESSLLSVRVNRT